MAGSVRSKVGASTRKHFQSVTTDESRTRRAPATAGGALVRVFELIVPTLLQTLPAILFFSYQPVIPLAETDSMNLELSLPLLWLAAISLLSLFRLKTIFKSVKKPTLFALAIIPCYATISTIWSSNPLRTFLTAGIIWCIAITTASLISYLKTINKSERREFFTKTRRIFLTAAVLVSVFAWLQCILDIAGVSRTYTLLCEGCTYNRFGFPHPNGFAIEPQFFGNLLLAPTLLTYYSLLKNKTKKSQATIWHWGIAIFLTVTLFFSFSRGAIYAFLAASAFYVLCKLFKKQKKSLILIPVILGSFLLSLVSQGVFAQISPTSDTFLSGITKSLHHLSLGHLDLRNNSLGNSNEDKIIDLGAEESASTGGPQLRRGVAPDTRDGGLSGRAPVEADSSTSDNDSIFDGYVEESTDFRLELNDIALDLWNDSPKTILIGTGLGGAGKTAYQKYQSLGTEKQIIQNEYLSLLLEFGLVGIGIILLAAALIIKQIRPISLELATLLLAYGLSLFFFSGLPNALHIYLLPAYFFLAKHYAPIE